MLQRVALGQVRFNLPGLTVDARGVVGGKQLAVRFAAMDRLVGFFRALAAEQSLDDLQPGLRIVYARGTAGTREAVVFLPASTSSSQLGDVVARAARLAGGQPFTGSGKHFVQFRDAGAPLGYDAAASSQEAADFILYGTEHDVAYHVDSELSLTKLLLRLSLVRDGASVWSAGPILLAARRGLGPLVAEYLHRARTTTLGLARAAAGAGEPAPRRGASHGRAREAALKADESAMNAGEPAMSAGEPATRAGERVMRAAAALCEMPGGAALRGPRAFWLFRVEGAPARLRGILTRTPGLELYTPVTDHVAVAAGYRHPIALESCRASFPTDRLTLFSREGGVVEIAPRPVFTAIEDVVRIRPPAAREVERTAARSTGRPDVAVPLRLETAADPRRRAVAALVPWARVPWLRRLCYALPGPALRGYRVAALERGVLVLSGGVLEGLPFGVLLDAVAPGVDVLVPLGTRLLPAVSADLLAERLGAQGGTLVVFPAVGAPPFRVAPELVEPLDRRALSLLVKPDEEPAAARDHAGASPAAPVEIENDPLGPMPLWGLER